MDNWRLHEPVVTRTPLPGRTLLARVVVAVEIEIPRPPRMMFCVGRCAWPGGGGHGPCGQRCCLLAGHEGDCWCGRQRCAENMCVVAPSAPRLRAESTRPAEEQEPWTSTVAENGLRHGAPAIESACRCPRMACQSRLDISDFTSEAASGALDEWAFVFPPEPYAPAGVFRGLHR